MSDESVTEKNILKRLKNRQRKMGAKPEDAADAPIDARGRAEIEISAAIEKSAVKTQRDATRKTRLKQFGGGGLALLLAYGIYLLFIPYKGDLTFGVCKEYLELNTRYPTTLRLSSVEQFETSVRIWYSVTDGFGDYRLEPIQCYFRPDKKTGLAIDHITVDRREEDPDKIAAFNRILIAVLKNPPDLTLPAPLPDSLEGLKLDASNFFRPLYLRRLGG